MKQYRTGFDRIQAGDSFKARMETLMTEMNGSPAAGSGREAVKSGGAFTRSLRWLAPVAALAVALAVLLSIPSVSRGIWDWFYDFFSADRYLRVPADERVPDPDYDSVIVPRAEIEQTNTVLLLSETDQLDVVNAYRKENGYPAYAPEEWAWLKDMQPYISDLYYDGVYFKTMTFFPCDPRPFMSGYIDGSISPLRLDVLSLDDGTVTNLDTGEVLPLFPSAHGLTPQKDYWNADGSANVENMLEDGGVWLFTEYCEMDLTPGRYRVSIQHQILDDRVGEMSWLGTVAVLEQSYILDTTAALNDMTETALPDVAFSGAYPFTKSVWSESSVAYSLETLDLDGLIVSPVLQARRSGLRVLLSFTWPESWSAEYRQAFAEYQRGLAFELVVDGAAKGLVDSGLEQDGRIYLEIPMTESERGACQTMLLRPTVHTLTQIVLNGQTLHVADGCTVPHNTGFDPVFTDTPLPSCDIVIPLS